MGDLVTLRRNELQDEADLDNLRLVQREAVHLLTLSRRREL